MIFTMAEIKTYWDDYSTKKVMRVLNNGEWELVPLEKRNQSLIASTRAEIVPLKKVQSFPEYLEKL
jgi:hypothetical protein